MRVRIPAIAQQTLDVNPSMHPDARGRLAQLRDDVALGRLIQPLLTVNRHSHEDQVWLQETSRRSGDTWHDTDWFFAETYFYRKLMEAVSYFEHGLDPFAPIKRAEYASPEHRAFLDSALSLKAPAEKKLHALLGFSIWGNRADLSYAESRAHGTSAGDADLLCDERDAVVDAIVYGRGDIHLVTDNAGTELSADLVLVDMLLAVGLPYQVCLHVKAHPTFVSDVTSEDVYAFVLACERGEHGAAAQALGTRLHGYIRASRLLIKPDAYWNSARFWWEMPKYVSEMFGQSRLILVKGDANYRRIVGDAFWPTETPFSQIAEGFGHSIVTLRTLKSDPLVGISAEQSSKAQLQDPRWRWSGRFGVIQGFLVSSSDKWR
jgi:uncharacterized protein with ATP-grasp and redox domains